MVIGKDVKNVIFDSVLDYVVVFIVGNDVLVCKLQRDLVLVGGILQWGFFKGFDIFVFLGFVFVRLDFVGDLKRFFFKIVVDGEMWQEEFVEDLFFDCVYFILYLLIGIILQKGLVIMIGILGGK